LDGETGERGSLGLLGLLHPYSGNVEYAAGRKVRWQLEHDLDRVAGGTARVGIAAQRPGHADLALGNFDIGPHRKLGRLAGAGRHRLGPPDRRADRPLAVRIVWILLI